MKRVYWIPFSHLDLGFYGTRQEALSRGNSIISHAMEMARKEKDFRFLIETVNFLENFVKAHPDKVKNLRELVKAGKIELLPEWSGIFQSCMDGEVMVRNILYSKIYLEEKFGVNPPSIQFTDIGELTPQIPQILRGLEVYYCVNSRDGPEKIPLYWMEGLDGSRVLVLNLIFYGYVGAMAFTKFGLRMDPKFLRESKFEEVVKWLSLFYPVSIGMYYGIDGYVPEKNICELARQWNAQSQIKIYFTTLTEYFNLIKKEKGWSKIPVLKGELRGVWVGGTGTSPSAVKDTETVSTLLSAEKFATIAYLLGKLEDPSRKIREIWIRILNAFDHNGDPEGKIDRQFAYIEARHLLKESLVSIAEDVRVPRGENVVPIAVFNPLSWKRSGIVSLHYSQYSQRWEMPFCNSEFVNKSLGVDLGFEHENLEITDSAGNIVPYEVTNIDRFLVPNGILTFEAKDVPPIGYKTYYIRFKEKAPAMKSDLSFTDEDNFLIAENSRIKLKIDKTSGSISIENLKANKTIVKDAQLILYRLTEKGVWIKEVDFNKYYRLMVKNVKLERKGPVKLEIKILGRLSGAEVQVTVTLYRENNAVDITIKTDNNFKEKGFLVFDVPTTLLNPRIDYGVPYGTNSWDNYVSGCKPDEETPVSLWESMRNMEKFLVLSDKSNSVIIASYGKGFRKEEKGVSLTLSFVGEGSKGEELLFKHRLLVGEKDEAKKAYKIGWEFTSPLIPIGVYDAATEKKLPPEYSFCAPFSDNIVVSVIKKAERSDHVIIRYYEAEGRKAASEIKFMGKLGKEFVNMLERPLKEEEVNDVLRPFEIRTVRFPVHLLQDGNPSTAR